MLWAALYALAYLIALCSVFLDNFSLAFIALALAAVSLIAAIH